MDATANDVSKPTQIVNLAQNLDQVLTHGATYKSCPGDGVVHKEQLNKSLLDEGLKNNTITSEDITQLLDLISTRAQLTALFENHFYGTYEEAEREDWETSYRHPFTIDYMLNNMLITSEHVEKFEKILGLPEELPDNVPCISSTRSLNNFFDYLDFWNKYAEHSVDFHTGGTGGYMLVEDSTFILGGELSCPPSSYGTEILIRSVQAVLELEKKLQRPLTDDQKQLLLTAYPLKVGSEIFSDQKSLDKFLEITDVLENFKKFDILQKKRIFWEAYDGKGNFDVLKQLCELDVASSIEFPAAQNAFYSEKAKKTLAK